MGKADDRKGPGRPNFSDLDWCTVNLSHDWAASPSFDIKSFLHAGENIIAIAVSNTDNAGGMGNGVSLVFSFKTVVPHWQRSAFNGLTQVLVQSTGEPGEIKLMASVNGLTPATAIIQAKTSE